ncbi:MAG: hypothetical protein AB1758_23375, partial [Candidatus Eremiobacterota bacterium]
MSQDAASLPLSERTLVMAARVASGQASTGELVSLVEQLVMAARQGRDQFAADSARNPEITPEETSQILEAMDRYVEALDNLARVARTGSAGDMEGPVRDARQHLTALREHQKRYLTACQDGPAMHPYLNRLLAHLEGLAERDTDPRHTLALLQDLPRFLEEIAEQVSGIDEPLVLEPAQAALADVESRCGRLREALEQGFAGVADRPAFLQEIREAVVQASDRVAEGLGFQFELDLAVGRTPYPPVNLVLAATD